MRRKALYLAAACLVVPALLLGGTVWHRRRMPKRMAFQEVILERQVAGMRDLIGTMRDSSLIPGGEALVIVDQDLVRDLLTAAIPLQRELGNGVTISVSSANVSFQDGLALVQLDGRASLGTGGDAYTDVTVYGDLHQVELDPDEGLLKGKVDIIAFDEKTTNIGGLKPSIKDLVEDLSELGLADLAPLNYTIDIPVRLASQVRIPAIGESGDDVFVPAAAIPMNVSVDNVKSFRGKLWITIDVRVPGAEKRGEEHPGAPGPDRTGSS